MAARHVTTKAPRCLASGDRPLRFSNRPLKQYDPETSKFRLSRERQSASHFQTQDTICRALHRRKIQRTAVWRERATQIFHNSNDVSGLIGPRILWSSATAGRHRGISSRGILCRVLRRLASDRRVSGANDGVAGGTRTNSSGEDAPYN